MTRKGDDAPAKGARKPRASRKQSRSPAPETATPEVPASDAGDAAPAGKAKRARKPKAPAPAAGSDAPASPPRPRKRAASRALGDLDAPAPLRTDLRPEERLHLEENDADNAARLFSALHDRVIYVPSRGWHILRDGRFAPDTDEGDHVFELATRLRGLVEEEARAAGVREVDDVEAQREIAAEAARADKAKRAPAFTDADGARRAIRTREKLAREAYATRCGNNRLVDQALRALRPHVLVNLDDLNRDPWKLVVGNGVLDLAAVRASELEPGSWLDDADEARARAALRRTWLRPFDATFKPTRRSAVRFDPAAECPEFRKFMVLIFPKEDLRAFAYQLLALLLIGENVKQIVIFLHGAGGNGKSTLLRILETILGEYYSGVNIEVFLADRNASASQASPHEYGLPGARAIVATEPDAADELSTKKLKAFTGGDLRQARALNRMPFTYRPSGIPIIAANRFPRIKDDSPGFWRRFKLLPFTVDLRDAKKVAQRDMGEVIAALEAEAPGILNALLDCLPDAIAGLREPEEVGRLVKQLRGVSSPVKEFVDDCCERTEAPITAASYLYRAFKRFSGDEGGRSKSLKAFCVDLIQLGFDRQKLGSGVVGYNLRLLPEVENDLAASALEDDHAPPF